MAYDMPLTGNIKDANFMHQKKKKKYLNSTKKLTAEQSLK